VARKSSKSFWLVSAASAAITLSLSPAAFAQQTVATPQAQGPQEGPQVVPDDQITKAETIVVLGSIAYRNRSEETAPVLEYGLDYFQRFEPLSAGDALKRVPSVTFLSDVIESDGARMRGLDPGYTQILINGEQVPGSNDDRSFFLDRIPAELIERVEIIRSSSANRSGDAVAGALNIVLRDGYSLDGGYLRAGALLFDDNRVRESLAGVWGGEVGPGRLIVGGNVQGRRNPKIKSSLRFGDSPENNPDYAEEEFDNREDQLDTRNGTDYSANATYTLPLSQGSLEFGGYYVHTDRTESEFSTEYSERTGFDPDAIETIVPQVEDILQDNYALNARLNYAMFGGETKVRLGFAEFKDDITGTEEESEYDESFPVLDDFGGERTLTDRQDREYKAKLAHERDLTDSLKLEFGVDYQKKEREADIQTLETGDPDDDYEFAGYELSSIEETRLDPFAMVSGRAGAVAWEAGLRYETTDVDVTYATFDEDREPDEDGAGSTDYGILLPSAHVKIDLTSNDRLSISAARTVRRPNFNFLNPLLLDGEYGDNDFIGDPGLEPETAWGGDIGVEHRLGRQGVIGVNVFYRKVDDLIELYNTGAPSEEACDAFEDDTGLDCEDAPAGTDFDSFLLSARNTGDGEVYGVEFDASTPLDFIGLPDTGVFLNYSWLDSKVNDEIGERRFNDQADYVFNVGFIHDMPQLAAAFGATFRKQGDAFGRIVAEEVTTSYGEDLEIFVEKRIGDRFTIRAVGSNLLNASKDETFNKFNTLADQIDRDFDEYELETEEAGPVFQLVGRYSF
jgi:outer membrane receptor protein involved in Fe transport